MKDVIERKGMCSKLQPSIEFLEVKFDWDKTHDSFNAEWGPAIIFFFKSTIYYTGCNGSPCLQEELCIEYHTQYPNLFMQLPNTKDY